MGTTWPTMGERDRTSRGSCSPSAPSPGLPCLLSSLSASGLTGAASVLGECCLWRGLLAPYYSWGSRRLKSLGSAALHCEATSSPGQHCSPWQSRSRPDLTHLTTGRLWAFPPSWAMEPERMMKVMAPKERSYARLRTGQSPSQGHTAHQGTAKISTSSWPPTFEFFHCTVRRSGQNNPGPGLP